MQHLAKKVPNAVASFTLEDWLQGNGHVPIHAIQSGEPVQRGRIYVTPRGTSAFLNGRSLYLESLKGRRPVTTIDRLFESAAQEYGDQVIAVAS